MFGQIARLAPEFRFALQETGDAPVGSALDRALPRWDYADNETVFTVAGPDQAMAALRRVDMGRAWLMRLMLSLRLPYEVLRQQGARVDLGYTFNDFPRFGFCVLPAETEHELVFGLIGRFWTPGVTAAHGDAARFARFAHPDYAKLAMRFAVSPRPAGGSRIDAEIRVRCLSDRARWIFTGYWRMIRPMNGAIRRQLLRAAAAQADGSAIH